MTHEQLERRVRLLTAYAVGLTGVLVVVVLAAFSNSRPQFDEIDVQRINVREPDGQLALVIANEARLPGNIMNDLEYSDRMGEHGIVFYNSEGDEAGALLLHSSRSDSGGVEAFSQLSLDRFEGDQVVALRYLEGPDYYASGLRVSDQKLSGLVEWSVAQDSIRRLPEEDQAEAFRELRRQAYLSGNWEVPRVFVGKQEREALVTMRDTEGRLRIRLSVDSTDTPRLIFFDAEGNVIQELPEN